MISKGPREEKRSGEGFITHQLNIGGKNVSMTLNPGFFGVRGKRETEGEARKGTIVKFQVDNEEFYLPVLISRSKAGRGIVRPFLVSYIPEKKLNWELKTPLRPKEVDDIKLYFTPKGREVSKQYEEEMRKFEEDYFEQLKKLRKNLPEDDRMKDWWLPKWEVERERSDLDMHDELGRIIEKHVNNLAEQRQPHELDEKEFYSLLKYYGMLVPHLEELDKHGRNLREIRSSRMAQRVFLDAMGPKAAVILKYFEKLSKDIKDAFSQS